MDKKIGICIAGYGSFGKKLRSYLEKIPEAEVRYLYHPDEKKAESFGEKGISDLNKVFADESVEAFVIATPNDQHFALLLPILELGKHHTFVEKPMTNSLTQALSLQRLVKLNEKVFMVGHCQRREPAFRRAKELLEQKAIGKVVNVNFNLSHGGAFTVSPENWRCSKSRHELGPLITLGSHCVDTILHLFGEIKEVFAVIENISEKTEAPDSCSALLHMENKAVVFLQNNYNVPGEKYCFISGTEGAIYIERGKIWLKSGRDYAPDGKKFIPEEKIEVVCKNSDPIEEELKEFLDAIRKGVPIETGFSEGLEVMRILDACATSASG